MTDGALPELTAANIISLIARDAYPREAVLTIARGFLPLSQDDLITVLAYLTRSADQEIATTAAVSLAEVPARIILAHAGNEAIAPSHLVLLLEASADSAVLEALLRNRSLPDDAVEVLARHADSRVQEVIVINQARLLRAPGIVDALLANPSLSSDVRRRALEFREEFFEKKQRREDEAAALIAEALVDESVPLEAIADLLEEAAAIDAAGTPQPPPLVLTPSEMEDPRKLSILAQILKMNTAQKVILAFRGDKTVRSLLVRERSRIICSAAIRNPRMTDSEAEAIAALRSVEDEVLRIISKKREWMAKYPIVLALCRNPKAPIGVVLPLISRLTLRDLKGLKDDKGISEPVRTMARKLFQNREKH